MSAKMLLDPAETMPIHHLKPTAGIAWTQYFEKYFEEYYTNYKLLWKL